MNTPLMPAPSVVHRPARAAGVLYLGILVLGLGAEFFLRAPFATVTMTGADIATLRTQAHVLPWSIAADLLMLCGDVVLAVLLFGLLRAGGPATALAAMVFRLMQAAVLGANLLLLTMAWLLLTGPADASGTLAAHFLVLHRHGYDLGLVFFGVCSLLTARLLRRTGWAPTALAVGVAVAGIVYLTGSLLRLLAPHFHDAFAVAYLLPIVVETALCLVLIRARRSGVSPADQAPSAAAPSRSRSRRHAVRW